LRTANGKVFQLFGADIRKASEQKERFIRFDAK